jgi:tRNA pseudouridine38-40 synthase
VAHFEAAWSLPTESLASALNVLLPPDVSVRAAEEASGEFHARFDATSRIYRYAILNRPTRSALLARFAHHERRLLDVERMAGAARELIGSHDFAAFGMAEEPGKSTVRSIDRFVVKKHRDVVLVSVRGNAFLRSQVRAMVGTLLLAGRGKLGPDDVRQIRQSRSRASCPALAPAKGLCLVRVDYDGIRFEAEDRRK